MKIVKRVVTSSLVSLALLSSTAFANDTVVPYGNGAWIYDGQYSDTGKKLPTKAGTFVQDLSNYNNEAPASHRITQLFAYGGDIEMYCRGSGESKKDHACSPNSLLVIYFPTSSLSKSHNTWEYWQQKLGDSGFASQQAYLDVPHVNQHIVDMDGRVDNKKEGEYDYLDHFNDLDETEAKLFADKVAKTICSDNSVDGVQFDIEPFSFTGGHGGTYSGSGQKYFYTEIAKDFAGYYGSSADPEGINHSAADPLRCVNAKHPNGRVFSVFTFSKYVTPDVVNTFNHHGNGYIVDSLYDLGPEHGGHLTSVDEFNSLVKAEIAAMATKGVPYQFAIPAAASAHEFESGPFGEGVGSGHQIDYVKTVIKAINPQALQASDPNFKGIDLWSWNTAMWWHGGQFTPAKPPKNVQDYLKENL